MKRSRITAGLALLACLAAGSATVVFGQLAGSGPVQPPLRPVQPTVRDDGTIQPPLPPGEVVVSTAPKEKSAVVVPPLPRGLGDVVVPTPPQKGTSTVVVPMPAKDNFEIAAPRIQSESIKQVKSGPPQPVTPQRSGQSASLPAVPSLPTGKSASPQAGSPPNVFLPNKQQTPTVSSIPDPIDRQDILMERHERAEAAAVADNPTGRQEPGVSLEWVGPPTARLNEPSSYQILAKNVSNTTLNNLVVRYQIPTGVRVAGSEPSATKEGDTLVWNLGTISPAQDKRIDLELVPTAKVVMSCQASVTFSASSMISVQVREPKLVLKAASQEQIPQGDVATVALTVSNPGDATADHVKIKANLPDGLEHARGKVLELELGSLSPGENRTVQLVCLAKAAGQQLIHCEAQADSNLKAHDEAKLEIVLPRLDLEIVGPKLRYLERHATYVFKVTNPGSGPASNVNVMHQLPQGFKFDTASNGGRHDFTSRTTSWFVGDLAPGETREVSMDVIAVNIGEHRHLASATAARGLKTEAETITRVEGLSALLMELVDTDDPVEVGAETSYEIRVTNTGSKTETNLELSCTVPEKMEFRAAKCLAGCRYRVEGKEIVFEPLPRLAPRADVIYRVVVRGLAPGDMRFRARIRSDGLSEPVLREESTKVYGDELPGAEH